MNYRRKIPGTLWPPSLVEPPAKMCKQSIEKNLIENSSRLSYLIKNVKRWSIISLKIGINHVFKLSWPVSVSLIEWRRKFQSYYICTKAIKWTKWHKTTDKILTTDKPFEWFAQAKGKHMCYHTYILFCAITFVSNTISMALSLCPWTCLLYGFFFPSGSNLWVNTKQWLLKEFHSMLIGWFVGEKTLFPIF